MPSVPKSNDLDLDDLSDLALIVEAERSWSALSRALALCIDDRERRELIALHEWLKPYRGGALQ